AKVTLRQGDVFEVMEEMKRYKERFDVVAIYGLLYHTTEHYRLLLLAQAMQPKLIIVDSEFIVASDGPIIRFMREDVENELNTVARRQGHQVELVGTPSMRLMDVIGEVTGHSTEWVDWDTLPEAKRAGLSDYFRKGAQRRRGTVALRPLESFDPREKRSRTYLDPRAK
ncbi:MAG: hypothetical protein AAF618_04465, partial [Pseudomonadota bacterium]